MNKKLENTVVIIGTCLCVWLCFVITQGVDNSKDYKSLELITESYRAESDIKSAQITELALKLQTIESEAYNRGYEHGKIYMGVAQVHGKGMTGYTDGYHAAVSQFYMESQLQELGKQYVEAAEKDE